MNTNVLNTVREEKGFTLVELAVVMIIIGLLIGGILKGQEMIANAQITSTVAQAKAMDAATSTFRDQYDALPGDMRNATTRLVGCAAPCVDGNGDGRLGGVVGAVPTAAAETLGFFPMLRLADLVTGFDGTAAVNFGAALPTASAGGGFTVGYAATGAAQTGFTIGEMRSGHYIVLTGQPVAVAAGTGKLTPTQGARIDRKMDDGISNTGSVISDNFALGCRNAATDAEYDENAANSVCNIAIRIQG